ncbi:hypothetical protein F5Y19DRAFT_486031 [Xylariaceae sp. FL1651]|nr:hypothetical protein F5Y19DRAFT_486031 [Xylariaceae sp. FL1651]
MSEETSNLDALGKLFTPDEKTILRSKAPEKNQEKKSLVKRLSDNLTFRTSPRTYPITISFMPHGLEDRFDISSYQLPRIDGNDLIKAEGVLASLTCQNELRTEARPIWHSTPEELGEILRHARGLWTEHGRDEHLGHITDSIPNYEQIDKFVCIGISSIVERSHPNSQQLEVRALCLAQHLAVITRSIVFTILDPSYGKQEHFQMIDNNTMLISFSIPPHMSIMPIVSEYARPVAMIWDAYDYLINGGHPRPAVSRLWSSLKYRDQWVAMPGHPIEAGVPFYTVSAGQMLEDYDIAVNLAEFDTKKLTNRFDLNPDTNEGQSSNVPSPTHFSGRRSRLFVRKLWLGDKRLPHILGGLQFCLLEDLIDSLQ